MRRACGLSLAAGGLLAAVVAAQPAPTPPGKLPAPAPVPGPSGAGDPARLKADVEALVKERADALKTVPGGAKTSAEREVLQQQLLEILKRIENRPVRDPFKGPAPPAPGGGNKLDLPPPGKAVDQVKAGENYYRAGEFEAALGVFREVNPALLSREDRAFAQYMAACCYRKTGRRSQAAQLYREVAEAKDDEFLSECAIWQLSLIRSTQELEVQLEQLRSRAKSR